MSLASKLSWRLPSLKVERKNELQQIRKPRRRAVIRLPEKVCEKFFVLIWDRNVEQFTLITDDVDKSSYDLGDDIQHIMRIFDQRWGMKEFGCRCIDLAKEFGSVQGIPSQDRTIIRPGQRNVEPLKLDWQEEGSVKNYYLPTR